MTTITRNPVQSVPAKTDETSGIARAKKKIARIVVTAQYDASPRRSIRVTISTDIRTDPAVSRKFVRWISSVTMKEKQERKNEKKHCLYIPLLGGVEILLWAALQTQITSNAAIVNGTMDFTNILMVLLLLNCY